VPDFVVNAGGAIAAAQEVGTFEGDGEDTTQRARAQTEQTVTSVLTDVFDSAERKAITPHEAAVALAKQRIAELMQ